MKEHLNTFNKGMNADLTKIAPDYSQSILNGTNIRILSEFGQSTLAIENIKGNTLATTFDGTSNVLAITTTDGFAPGLLTAATEFTLEINYTIGITDIQILQTITNSDVNWPVLPFDNALMFYQWLASFINSASNVYNVYAYFDEDGLYIAYLDGVTTLTIDLTADADWTFGPVGDPSNPDVLYSDYSPVINNPTIIGYTNIRDDIYVFTTDCTTVDPGGVDPASLGQIWLLSIDPVTLAATKTLIYNDYLNFTTQHPIQAVGRYENVSMQKVYWTDNFNYVRYLNVVDPLAFVVRPDNTNLFPASSFTPPILSAVAPGGAVDIAVYQLTYRLKRSSGTLSTIAMPSNLVSIYRKDDSHSSYCEIVGEDLTTPAVPTGKRIIWQIDNIDNSFDYLQPVIIKRTSYSGTPEVLQLDPIAINASSSVRVDYSGLENAETITLEEFLLLSSNFFTTCKTITTSNNMLLAGNIKSSKRFDADFDARAYRFTCVGSGSTSYITPDLLNVDTWGIPLDDDVINPHNHHPTEFLDFHYNHDRFKYQSDGVTLGGEGPNIKYTFVDRALLEDKNTQFGNGNNINSKNILDPKTRVSSTQVLNDFNYQITQAIPNHKSAYFSGLYRGYKRGETYRFGIVFYDKRGNPGYVKWIGDIRFPRAIENQGIAGATYGLAASSDGVSTVKYRTVAHNFSSKETYTYQLGIEFEVSIPPALSDQITGYSIVRVKRELKDRSVLSSGFIGSIMDVGPTYAHPSLLPSTLNWSSSQNAPDAGTPATPSFVGAAAKDALLFYSPEYQFSRNTDIVPKASLQSDYLYIDRYSAQLFSPHDRDPGSNDFFYTKLYYETTTVNGAGSNNLAPFNGLAFRSYSNPIRSITNFPRLTSTQNQPSYRWYTGSPVFHNEVVRSNLTTIGLGNSGILLGLQSPSSGVSPMIYYQTQDGIIDTKLGAINSSTKYLGDICRLLTDQYGGQGYEARALNDYISCGHYQSVDYSQNTQTFNSIVFGGDTFVNLWANYKIFASDGLGNGWVTNNPPGALAWNAYTPVETYINTHLRHRNNDNSNPTAIEDFLYNSVYSAENDVLKYFPKPSASTFNEVDEFDTRIYISDVKVNGETTESWAIFRQGNYLDLEGSHGPLNNLVSYNTTVATFQDSAIGILNVAPKFMISDSIGTEEALLGTGKPLEGYSYMTTGAGSKHQWGITKGSYAGVETIYFFDAIRKALYALSGNKVVPLLGLDSYIRTQIRGTILDEDNPIAGYGVTAAYDTTFNEAWFTFKTSRLPYKYEGIAPSQAQEEYSATVSYCAPISAFNSFYSFTPSIYIQGRDKILSPDGSSLYLHNYGAYGEFYGQVEPSTVTVLVNPDIQTRKVLYSLGFPGEVLDIDGYNIASETWDRVRVYNDYQNTDWVTLTPGSTVERKERMWSMNSLRNVVYVASGNIFDPANFINTLSPTDLRVLFPDRLRDFYFTIQLEYLNSNNRKIILPYIRSVLNQSPR